MALAPASAAPLLPEAFHGRWNPDIGACSHEPVDEVRIDADGLSYYEWTHEAYAVRKTGKNGIAVSARLFSPEVDLEKPVGKVRLRLTLLAGGQRLAYRAGNAAQQIYVRCPGRRSG